MHGPANPFRYRDLLVVLIVSVAGVLGGCGSSPTEPRELLEYHFLITGTAVSVEGREPIAGARVELYHRRLRGNCGFKGGSGCYAVYHVFQTVYADDEGRYELDATFTANSCLGFGLRARAFGFEELHRYIPFPCDGAPVEIELPMKPLPPPAVLAK
jgi:hypothetical protein